jgi:hypothetical protein
MSGGLRAAPTGFFASLRMTPAISERPRGISLLLQIFAPYFDSQKQHVTQARYLAMKCFLAPAVEYLSELWCYWIGQYVTVNVDKMGEVFI